jgi:hypothetical protein
MFILNFIPNWFFPLLALLALVVFIISRYIKLPQAQLVHYASIVVFSLAVFMCGANFNNEHWLAKVREVEQQLALAQAESAKENTKIVEKIVTKREVVRVQGSDIIKYVDREKIVIDESCKIPEPVIDAHNRAVKLPEDKK